MHIPDFCSYLNLKMKNDTQKSKQWKISTVHKSETIFR